MKGWYKAMKKNKIQKYIPEDWQEYKARAAFRIKRAEARREVREYWTAYQRRARTEFTQSTETLMLYNAYWLTVKDFARRYNISMRTAAYMLNVDRW